MKVVDIFNFLNLKFPVSDAMDFDNAGLLIGDPQATVTNALTALDCTAETVNFAAENGCELIITHHPVIFEPLKNILAGSLQYELVKNNIAVISMHTNLDVGIGGVNETLCKYLMLSDIANVTAQDGFSLKSGTLSPISAESLAQHIKKQLGGIVKFVDGGRLIERVLVCSGSGGNYIDDAIRLGFDALITSEVKHHQFLNAIQKGVSLFDGGHFNTENIIAEALAELLQAEFKTVQFKSFHSEIIKFA